MIDVVNKAINRKLKSLSITDIVSGIVESINPLKIRLNDRIVIGLDFIEPKSLGISDDSPSPALPFIVGDKIQLIRYNDGQRFYILGAASSGGAGTGDMLSSMYDPTGKQADVFDYDNFDNTPTFKTINGETITGSGDLEIIGVEDGDKGDVTVTDAGETWTIDNGVVSNSKLSNMIADTIKGRVTDTGSPQDLNASQVRTIINVEDGAQVNNIVDLEELPEPSSGYINNIYKVDNKLYVCIDNSEIVNEDYYWEEYGGNIPDNLITSSNETVTDIMSLTQAEYDALPQIDKDNNTYFITDDLNGSMGNYVKGNANTNNIVSNIFIGTQAQYDALPNKTGILAIIEV